MLKNPLHIMLLLTFALLQCAAPLVHAHVNGEHTGIIPPTLAAPYVQNDQLTQTESFIEADESPAISLASELQRNDTPAIPQPSWVYTAESRTLSSTKFRPITPYPASFVPPYRKSLPQAPPALS